VHPVLDCAADEDVVKRTKAEWQQDCDQLGQEVMELTQHFLNHTVSDEVVRAKTEEHRQRIEQLREEMERGFDVGEEEAT
jgi:hypothetical protein